MQYVPTSDLLRTAALACLMFIAACSPAEDFRLTGGEVVPGSYNNHSMLGGAFSLSPDGRWLYSTNYDPVEDPISANAPFEQGYLLRLADGEKLAPRFSQDARAALAERGVLDEAGCWKGKRLWIRDPFRGGFVIEPAGQQPTWQVAPGVPCRRFEPVAPGIEVVTGPDGSASVMDGNQVLARYSPLPLIGSPVQVIDPLLSPDGDYLAYGVSQPVGSLTGNTTAYLVRRDGRGAAPVLLVSPAGTMRFSPDSRYLHIHTRSFVEDDHRWLIVRWKLPVSL